MPAAIARPRPSTERAGWLRLALFTDTFAPQVNGVTRTLDRLVAAVEARGGAVRVETTSAPGACDDARVSRWPSMPFWAYPQLRIAAPAPRQVLDRLGDWRPTLVHATTPFGVGLAGRAVARRLGVPFVTSFHTAYASYLRHYRLGALGAIAWPYQRWFHNSGARTYAPSRAVRMELVRRGIHEVGAWSRGVDLDRFGPRYRRLGLRAAVGAADDEFLVAYVGRLAPEKSVEIAIGAVRHLSSRYPGCVRLVVAGDGPHERRFRAMAPEGSRFAGMLDAERLAEFYASADALIFPSTTETFGNVLLEAMASGLPVVAPDRGATLEFANERSALLFSAGDAASAAHQLERLLLDRTLREQKRNASLRTAAGHSWDVVWDRLFQDYLEVVTSAESRPRLVERI